MRNLYFILSILVLLSCSSSEEMKNESDTYTLKIEYEYVDGLEANADVLNKGMKIGKVISLDISEDQSRIIAKIEIDKKYKIPTESSFTIFSADIMGRRAINIEYSESNKFLSEDDLVIGKNQMTLSETVDIEINKLKNNNFDNKYFKVLEDSDSVLIIKYFKKESEDETK